MGDFVTKGRLAGTGAPAPPFLMASGLSRTIEGNKRKVQPSEHVSSLQWSTSERNLGNKSQITEESEAKLSSHLTNSEPRDRSMLATSQKEYLQKIPSFKTIGAEDAGKSICR